MEGDFFQGWGGVRQALILSLCDGGFEINFCLMRGVHNFSQTSLKVIIALFLMKMIKKREEIVFFGRTNFGNNECVNVDYHKCVARVLEEFLKKMSKKSVCNKAFLTEVFMYAFTRHERSKNREKKKYC